MNRIRQHFFTRLWMSDPELVKFAQMAGILLVGLALFSGLLFMLYTQWTYQQALEKDYADALEYHQKLEAQNLELERIRLALAPAEEASARGMDWETLRYLSFLKFQMVAENEGIAYLRADQ